MIMVGGSCVQPERNGIPSNAGDRPSGVRAWVGHGASPALPHAASLPFAIVGFCDTDTAIAQLYDLWAVAGRDNPLRRPVAQAVEFRPLPQG